MTKKTGEGLNLQPPESEVTAEEARLVQEEASNTSDSYLRRTAALLFQKAHREDKRTIRRRTPAGRGGIIWQAE